MPYNLPKPFARSTNCAMRKFKNMQRKLRFPQALFLFPLLLFSLSACSDEESELEGKWQMRQLWQGNASVEEVDSVFFNFMDGVFTAICMGPEGQYFDFYGKYALEGDVLAVHSLYKGAPYDWDDPEKWDKPVEEHLSTLRFLLAWPCETAEEWPRKEEFRVERLTSSSLQLAVGDSVFVFRKY